MKPTEYDLPDAPLAAGGAKEKVTPRPMMRLAVFGLLVAFAASAGADDGTTYINQIKRRIMAVWRLPKNSEGLKVVIWMNLDKAGRISDVRVEESSGDEKFDASALQAVRRAAPFPPVPLALEDLVGDLLIVLQQNPPAQETPKEVKPAPKPSTPRAPAKPAPKKIPGQMI